MAKQLLFQFWVKPSGILASKRYANVFVDDQTGAVTTENVPGKEAINLPSVDDYKSSNYPYGEGNDISDFCNTETFTRFHLKATRTTPFAYTEAHLNDPFCGYLTPLPTPAVPPNPYGDLVFGLYATANFCDIEGLSKSINIHKRNFSGETIAITELGSSPIVENYTAGENKFTPIRPKELEFTFIASTNFQLENIYVSDEREYRLDIIDDATGNLDFSGFIVPDNSTEPFNSPKYPITVRATDGLGGLKTITYPMPIGSSTDVRQKFLHILAFALAKTNLDLDIFTMVNIFATGMRNGIGDDPLEQASVSPLRMTETNDDIYSCFDAIEAVCTEFGASIAQVNGQWRIGRITELAKGTGRYRLYDFTGRFKFSGTLSTVRNLGNRNATTVLEGGANMSTQNAYKLVKVTQEFGTSPAIVYNGNFEDWDGQNFRYWTRYGGIKVTRVQKSIPSSAGNTVLIDDYACRFMEKAVANKWLQDTSLWVNKGQTARLLLNIGKTDGLYDFKVRFNVGQYFLTNANGAFEWVAQLATTTIRIDNTLGSIFSAPISIEIPALPISGDMAVLFYGFVKLVAVNSGSPPPTGARPTRGSENGVNQNVVTYYEIDQYTPIDIDNVSISTTVDDKDMTKGMVNVSAQNGFYTNKPDEIKIIWGEFISGGFSPLAVTGSFDPTRPTRDGDPGVNSPQNQLQTIYISDGSVAKGWYEFGEITAPVPIGLALARAILKAYQTPYKLIDVTIKGDNLNYYDTFNIIVDGQPDFSAKIFMWQNATFDPKHKTAMGNLVEIFSKALTSNDYTTPDLGNNGDGGLLPIFQNPNPPIQINGIFTEEFDPTYR